VIRWLLLLVLAFVLWRLLRGALAPRAARPRVAWDPYAVLGVPRGASPDEIARVYREQMKRYHPDRVADLGPELQEVAHQKVLDIRRAYEELVRR
jgi:DnaJ-domain-containing protein 1